MQNKVDSNSILNIYNRSGNRPDDFNINKASTLPNSFIRRVIQDVDRGFIAYHRLAGVEQGLHGRMRYFAGVDR